MAHRVVWKAAQKMSIFQFDGTIRYEADLRDPEKASLGLQYEADGVPMDYRVHVTPVSLHLGGRRFAVAVSSYGHPHAKALICRPGQALRERSSL
jgi:hypothetical protein